MIIDSGIPWFSLLWMLSFQHSSTHWYFEFEDFRWSCLATLTSFQSLQSKTKLRWGIFDSQTVVWDQAAINAGFCLQCAELLMIRRNSRLCRSRAVVLLRWLRTRPLEMPSALCSCPKTAVPPPPVSDNFIHNAFIIYITCFCTCSF